MSFLPIIIKCVETEFGLRWGLLLVFLLENVCQIRVWDLWEAYCSRLFLIVLKCLFKDPIVVMLTLLTLTLRVNIKMLYLGRNVLTVSEQCPNSVLTVS